jgi:hypothetical protein
LPRTNEAPATARLRELFCFAFIRIAWLIVRLAAVVGYPSGQRGQTVNLLAYAFDGSNPSPTTTLFHRKKRFFVNKFTSFIYLTLFRVSLGFWRLLRSYHLGCFFGQKAVVGTEVIQASFWPEKMANLPLNANSTKPIALAKINPELPREYLFNDEL